MEDQRRTHRSDTTGGDGTTALSVLVGWIIGGLLLVTLLVPIVAGGGRLWLAPALAWAAAALFLVFDRHVARAERAREDGRDSAPRASRWVWIFPAVFFAFYVVAVVASGNPGYLIPAVILAAIVVGFGLLNRWAARRTMARHGGDVGEAMADSDDPWPTPQITDSDRPLGDTPEAHDEISPRDIPKWDRESRRAAEQLAAGREATRGGHAGDEAA